MFLIDKKKEKKTEFWGGKLTIDCGGCPNKGSAEDRACIACMCREINGHSDVESIMLHSGTDISFQGEALNLIRDLASVYSILTMDGDGRRGARCLACRNSYRHMVSDQLPNFPDIDTSALKERATQASARSGICEMCLSDSARLFDQIGSMMDSITGTVQKEAE